MRPTPSLFTSVRRTLALLILTLCGSFWAVVYVGETKLEKLSLHQWLKSEAKRVTIETIEGNPDYQPAPEVFDYYKLTQPKVLPAWLAEYKKVGLYEHMLGTEDKHFIISRMPNSNILFYIVFKHNKDDFLDTYESEIYKNSLVIVVSATLIIFLYCYLLSLWLSRPLSILQAQARSVGLRNKKIKIETKYKETQNIEQSLIKSQDDLEHFLQRENEFNRFASHELRTPIAVIAGSVELLQDVNFDPTSRIGAKTVERMQSASKEMQLLTDAFLLLGKEHIAEDRIDKCDLGLIVENQIDKLSTLFKHQKVKVSYESHNPASMESPVSFVTIAINNLLKNAFSYGEESIHIQLNQTRLTVNNQYGANKEDFAGYGVGLVIVERVSQKMGWSFSIEKNQNHFISQIDFSNTSKV
ncbi:sensor histidine kinase [Vibrio sp. T20]|uniref:sensor histidine kinase n=1 Tax=Vibrio sp. T20 TaxID=2588450 RepID=UPI0011B6701B|nr:HAMP domain-containing sensor histidine kinase [Vibrio sp. T20]